MYPNCYCQTLIFICLSSFIYLSFQGFYTFFVAFSSVFCASIYSFFKNSRTPLHTYCRWRFTILPSWLIVIHQPWRENRQPLHRPLPHRPLQSDRTGLRCRSPETQRKLKRLKVVRFSRPKGAPQPGRASREDQKNTRRTGWADLQSISRGMKYCPYRRSPTRSPQESSLWSFPT